MAKTAPDNCPELAVEPTTGLSREPVTPVLVVADQNVVGVEILLGSLAPGTAVLRIDGDEDPLPLVAGAVHTHQPTHLHLVCHGEPGAIRLGDSVVTGRPLASALAAAHPKGLATISLWACDTAAGTTGRRFLETLANGTGARVYGAAGPVGNPILGGSWELPVSAAPKTRVARNSLSRVGNPPVEPSPPAGP